MLIINRKPDVDYYLFKQENYGLMYTVEFRRFLGYLSVLLANKVIGCSRQLNSNKDSSEILRTIEDYMQFEAEIFSRK